MRVTTCLEKGWESLRKLENIRESLRKLEKEGSNKFEKIWEKSEIRNSALIRPLEELPV